MKLRVTRNSVEWVNKKDKKTNTVDFSCNCIGPQPGEPACPCIMRAKGIRKVNGRWIEPEKDLGPAE